VKIVGKQVVAGEVVLQRPRYAFVKQQSLTCLGSNCRDASRAPCACRRLTVFLFLAGVQYFSSFCQAFRCRT
jgi:hypothetical protein